MAFPADANAQSDAPSILVVEDDAAISDVVCTRLAKEGYAATAAFSGTEAQLLVSQKPFSLVITDLMLPGCSGEEVVRTLRAASPALPIIVMSARNSPSDKVDLLTLGADDYVAKPFDLDELAARVAVQLRHAAASQARQGEGAPDGARTGATVAFGRWIIDEAARTLTIDGQPVALTRTEFEIIAILARHPKRVFTKQELFEQAWGEPWVGQDATVTAHVSNLRAKLKPSGTDHCLETVWGLGFKLRQPE